MADKRIIKRYTNRKLYDKLESKYVTLDQIARLVRRGEDIKVVDNESEEDLTAVTFAQIILEEEKRKTNLLSVPFLRRLIRSGEARMQDLSDRASRGIEALGGLTEKAGERVREVAREGGRALEEGLSVFDDLFGTPQKRIDALREAVRRSVAKVRTNPTVRKELERIENSLRTLEDAICRLREEGKVTRPESPTNTAESEETEPLAAEQGAVQQGNGATQTTLPDPAVSPKEPEEEKAGDSITHEVGG